MRGRFTHLIEGKEWDHVLDDAVADEGLQDVDEDSKELDSAALKLRRRSRIRRRKSALIPRTSFTKQFFKFQE